MKTEPLTYPASEYTAMANRLVIAFNDCGTVEQTVYSVFDKIKNNADILKLKAVWGTRKWDGCLLAGEWDRVGTLDEAMTDELRASELAKVNNKLIQKGIMYTF